MRRPGHRFLLFAALCVVAGTSACTRATPARLLGRWSEVYTGAAAEVHAPWELALRQPPPSKAEVDALPWSPADRAELLEVIANPGGATAEKWRRSLEDHRAYVEFTPERVGHWFTRDPEMAPIWSSYQVREAGADATELGVVIEDQEAARLIVRYLGPDQIELEGEPWAQAGARRRYQRVAPEAPHPPGAKSFVWRAPQISVRLIDPGSEPRAPVRHRINLKAVTHIALEQRSDAMIQHLDHPPDSRIERHPAVRQHLTLGPSRLQDDGTVRMAFRFGDVELTREVPVEPRVWEAFKRGAGNSGPRSGELVVTPTGRVVEVAFDAGAAPDEATQLTARSETLMGLMAVFPDEPIGAGARWDLSLPQNFEGVRARASYRLTLIEFDDFGGRVHGQWSLSADPQVLAAAGKERLELVSFSCDGDFQSTFVRGELVATVDATVLSSAMVVSGPKREPLTMMKRVAFGLTTGGKSKLPALRIDAAQTGDACDQGALRFATLARAEPSPPGQSPDPEEAGWSSERFVARCREEMTAGRMRPAHLECLGHATDLRQAGYCLP